MNSEKLNMLTWGISDTNPYLPKCEPCKGTGTVSGELPDKSRVNRDCRKCYGSGRRLTAEGNYLIEVLTWQRAINTPDP